jgi:phosphoglucomutase
MLAGSKVVLTKDYQLLKQCDAVGNEKALDMPAKSNVLQWFTESGLKVSVRPSGTEPKIKFYLEVPVAGFTGSKDYDAFNRTADEIVAAIKKDLKL